VAEKHHVAAGDPGHPGDHAVARHALLVAGEEIELFERIAVDQSRDALARGQLALGVLALKGLGVAVAGLVPALAQLVERIGHYAVELLDARAAALLPVAHALYGMTHLAALCRLLPERDPHPQIHAALAQMLDGLLDPRCAAPGMVRFELKLLAELGFGLDLSACAASGVETDLVYVSPKSGRAVSRQAGEPWRDRLFALPAFLREASADEPSPQDIADGFALTGFFLARRVFEPRGLSLAEARASFIAALCRDARPAMAVG